MYRVIMAPTDGSEGERPAVDLAASLARQFDAELRLVRVETPPVAVDPHTGPGVLEQTEELLIEERRKREKRLEALGEELRSGDVKHVTTSLASGVVTATLRDYVREFKIDLIVMMSHSRGGLTRIALGSVTDYLIRYADVPVVVVKPSLAAGGHGDGTLSRILVPLDGSPNAEQILPHVAALAKRMGTSVEVLRVLTPSTYSQEQIMDAALPWWEADMAAARAYVERVVGRLVADGVRAESEVILGEDVAASILTQSTRIDADLIAIATHGVGGLRRLVFGSVADRVTRQSTTSLLVFHPGS